MADDERSGSSSDENAGSEGNSGAANKFANDGSFMEMFKKRMEEEAKKKAAGGSEKQTHTSSSSVVPKMASHELSSKQSQSTTELKKPSLPLFGKRRGAPKLKTGAVKKQKVEDKEDEKPKDAWSQYMAEVNKYKSQSCQDEDKTRPLVK